MKMWKGWIIGRSDGRGEGCGVVKGRLEGKRRDNIHKVHGQILSPEVM